MRTTFTLTLLLGLLSTAEAQSQVPGPLVDPGLRDYVAQVLQRNAGLAAADTRARASAERIRPAGALPDPTLSFGIMQGTTSEPFDLDRSDFTNLPIRLQQMFPFPGKQGASAQVARKENAVAAADLGLTTHTLAADAARAFYELAYARSTLAIWRQRVEVADQAVKVTIARYETGRAPQTEALRAQVRRAHHEEEGLAFAAEIEAAAARADALRRGPGEPVQVPDLADPDAPAVLAVFQDTLPGVETFRAMLATRSPSLALASAEVERARAEARVFALAARPDITLSLEYGPRVNREDFFTGMVGFTIPLWAGRKQSPAAEAARLDLVSAQRRYDDLLARLEGELRAQVARLDALRARIAQLREHVLQLAAAASESALRSYSVGVVDLTTVLEAQDDLFLAQLDLARLTADYGAQRAGLNALVGEEWYR